MKEISAKLIKEKIKENFLYINTNIDVQTLEEIKKAYETETDSTTKFALDIMIKNAKIAKQTCSPICQDTGMAVVFVEIGQEIHITDGSLNDAINQGVREAYEEGYFRKSVLSPLRRKNTLDNTPAIIHYDIVNGEKLKISIMAKGFGSENMSRVFMLTPADGIEGIKDAIIRSVKEAGSNPCPPVVVGVGIGGTMEKAAILSKKALFRELNSENKDTLLNEIEIETKNRINSLGIGTGGLGGKITALKVLIESFPTHLAGLPVAITMQCHAVRHISFEL